MRLYQILHEDFDWDSDYDRDMYISLKGLVNKNNGVFKSKKQRDFLLKNLTKSDIERTPQTVNELFGVRIDSDEKFVILSGMARWANYGARSMVSVRHAFVVDNIGVVKHVKLGNKGNLRDGSSPDPSKNKVEFVRPENVDASHLEKTEDEKKQEFKRALGMSEGEYIGKEGERVNIGPVEMIFSKHVGYSQAGTYHETMRFWNMLKDSEGRIIYYTGKELPLERGEKANLTARVKKHLVSKKGEKVTVVKNPTLKEI